MTGYELHETAFKTTNVMCKEIEINSQAMLLLVPNKFNLDFLLPSH